MKDRTFTVCVYGASSPMGPAVYAEAAESLGRELARRHIRLVTGAGRSGLMSAVNNGANAEGGVTVGIIPRFMHERGWTYAPLSEVIVTENMHERKQTMASLADAVIALPGGSGTLEELLEIITWRQLGLYSGQVVILNIDGFYDPLLRMFDRAVADRFMTEQHRSIWQIAASPIEAVEMALIPVDITSFAPKIN
ncbi:MAG: TIGR00730 family Rossman fold protein [Muribaculaceae bacterium]|nr:TIGR00730 family Rossman fold protein [Muribaculaceae bacterium]